MNIEFEDKNLSEMLDKNYIYSEHGKTFYVNGFPIQGSTTKRFITTEGRKSFVCNLYLDVSRITTKYRPVYIERLIHATTCSAL